MKTGDFLEKGENKAIGKGGKCPLFPALLNLSTCKYVLKIQGLFKSKHGLCISFFFFFFVSTPNRGRQYAFNREPTMAQCPLIVPLRVTTSPFVFSPPLSCHSPLFLK